MRRPTIAVLLVGTTVLTACGSADSGSGTRGIGGTGTAETAGTTITRPGGAPVTAGRLKDQFDQRYCEVLAVTIPAAGTAPTRAPDTTTADTTTADTTTADTTTADTRATVWGTQGLNACPQAGFDSLDTRRIAAQLGVTAAILNGPRYWVLDDIIANKLSGSGETRTFGNLPMRSIATVNLGPGVPDRSPYAEVSVVRDTAFSFAPGREIYELTSSDGSVYVMQSYSVESDPQLTVKRLAGLADRLKLPDGWRFTSRVLDEELVVEDIDGIATVVQDELHNSYQLRSRG